MWAKILAPMKFKNENEKKKKGGKVLEMWKLKTCACLFVYYLPHKGEKKRKKAEVMHTPWNLILVYLDAENDSFNSEQTVVNWNLMAERSEAFVLRKTGGGRT